MTEEEKSKAIAALKMSAPVKAVTQEEFGDYIQTLNKVMDWLEQEPCEDTISRKHLLSGIDELMQSPWFNNGKDFYDGTLRHYGYVERKEAVEVVRDLCIKKEPLFVPKTRKWKEFDHGMGIIFLKCPFCGEFQSKADNHNFCPNCGAKLEESK